jgi:hypothetical protein
MHEQKPSYRLKTNKIPQISTQIIDKNYKKPSIPEEND